MIKAREDELSWIHSDHLHSATILTDAAELRRLAYRAFGEEAENVGSGEAPKYRYTGKELDSSGLMYYGARYYDPAPSRFITPDTLYDRGPQGLNRYSYALNNPIRYNDPSGHSICGGNPTMGIMQPGTCMGAEMGGGGGVPRGYISGGAAGTGAVVLLYEFFSEMMTGDDENSDEMSSPAISGENSPAEPGNPKKPKRPPSGNELVRQIKKIWERPKGLRLPKDGEWSGTPGDSTFYPNNPEQYDLRPGQGVQFIEGRVDFSPFAKESFSVPGLSGIHSEDMPQIYDHIAEEKGWLKSDGTPNRSKARKWLREEGLIPHHADATGKVDLIPEKLHGNRRKGIPGIAHTGAAYELRNQ